MLYVEFLFLLLMLYIGSRYGGIGLGVVSGIGLVIEVFVFKMPPTSPPITVMLIILAVVTCASILEAAGGLKYMLQVAERMLRKNPKRVTLIAPFVTYTMTFMLGTGHAVYSIMPIIGDVALKNGIRPERPDGSSIRCVANRHYRLADFGCRGLLPSRTRQYQPQHYLALYFDGDDSRYPVWYAFNVAVQFETR